MVAASIDRADDIADIISGNEDTRFSKYHKGSVNGMHGRDYAVRDDFKNDISSLNAVFGFLFIPVKGIATKGPVGKIIGCGDFENIVELSPKLPEPESKLYGLLD